MRTFLRKNKVEYLYCLWYVKNVMVDKNIMRQIEYTSFLQFLKIWNDLESYGIYEEKFLWEMWGWNLTAFTNYLRIRILYIL